MGQLLSLILLSLILLGLLCKLSSAVPNLTAPHSLAGTWKGAMRVPCSYVPESGYTQISVEWTVVRNYHPATVFLRDSSGDHVQQTKFRGRLEVSRQPPGDVALTLNPLEMDDQGYYTCAVTWQNQAGQLIKADAGIDVRVQKVAATKPTVTTGSGSGFSVPQGMRVSLKCQADGSPPISYQWFKGEPGGDAVLVNQLAGLLFKPAVVTDTGSYFCRAKGRVGAVQQSDVVHFVVTVTLRPHMENVTRTTRMTSAPGPPWGTSVGPGPASLSPEGHVGHPGAASEKTGGLGLPFFAIILIVVLCCALLSTLVSILFCRRKSQGGHIYDVARLSSAGGPQVSIYKGADHPEAEANDYTTAPEPQPVAGGDYAQLLPTIESEYELAEGGKI
ncbi:V-set and immunoglobulin domain-containing protein 4 isoform X2 [Tachyglossus aculeatus]|uniref:V-set and immunoglobulin domain-containing protein 4 isoform X2 n=1 Tax=Tachyglossus aculeatus TaxID=9261 RepID=UPI0018F778EF|nr:V-set and immunoglobulin domain-containing protein 4 isoform X2 [Tachyglossus aculeatus]